MYNATTNGVRVTVTPQFMAEQSEPEGNRFFWAYTVEIANLSPDQIQLLARYWKITDQNGHVQEVRGPGVVGEQPLIPPGDAFEYTSGCPLSTPTGIMAGYYTVVNDRGATFDVAIPAFSLDSPHGHRTVN